MKKILNILSLGLLLICTSCDDFFPVPIESAITQDTVFSSMANAEKALNSAYYLIPYGWPTSQSTALTDGYRNDSKAYLNITAVLSDIAVTRSSWPGATKLYYNNLLGPLTVGATPSDFNGSTSSYARSVEFVFEEPYFYFRKAFLFLEGVDDVPNAGSDFLKESKAQAKLLIAIGYFELLKRHGSVPWVDHALTSSEEISEARPPLATFIQNIDDLINEAIELGLPDTYTTEDTGRLTAAAAYFLRARLWLWAASPIFNGDAPYLSMNDASNNDLISYGNYDVERWKKAATVAKEAIDYCESHGYALVNTGNPKEDYTLATRDLTGNTEVIAFSRRVSSMKASEFSTLYGRHMPVGVTNSSNKHFPKQVNFCCPTLNLVEMYETTDGSEVDLNTTSPWEKLDPRFHASIIHDGATFGGEIINIGDSKDQYLDGMWSTGFAMRKFLHEEHYRNPSLAFDAPYFYMRLPELYLIYAEALNECTPSDGDITTYLNKTRQRVGMSDLVSMGQDEMRQAIRKERTIEFAFEDKRFFDIKRWLIAEETIGGIQYGAKRQADGTYVKEVAEIAQTAQREWGASQRKYYLMPFPNYEIIKDKGLIQNPGY